MACSLTEKVRFENANMDVNTAKANMEKTNTMRFQSMKKANTEQASMKTTNARNTGSKK